MKTQRYLIVTEDGTAYQADAITNRELSECENGTLVLYRINKEGNGFDEYVDDITGWESVDTWFQDDTWMPYEEE